MPKPTLIIGLFIGFLQLTGCSNTQIIRGEKVNCQPVYGNWCGRGYPAYEVTGYKPRPVDHWDDACKRHDLCYDKYGEGGEDHCDRMFSSDLEQIYYELGLPVPRQIINAYNVFKEHKHFRSLNVSFEDLWNANTVPCDGTEGVPALFCDVNMGNMNCEVSIGWKMEGTPCFCDYPAMQTPMGFFPGGRLFGNMKTVNDM